VAQGQAVIAANLQLSNALRRWRAFPIQRQGEHDYACGAYCVVSAAIHLGTVNDDAGGLGRVLKNLPQRDAQQMAHGLLTWGTTDGSIRQVANASGLRVRRWNGVTLGDLRWHDEEPRSGIWMALVQMEFRDPRGVAPVYNGLHYVLVLEVTARYVILADPHPWHAAVYAMSLRDFATAWDARRGRSKWARYLSRSSGDGR
jgi:hypothetical protein